MNTLIKDQKNKQSRNKGRRYRGMYVYLLKTMLYNDAYELALWTQLSQDINF